MSRKRKTILNQSSKEPIAATPEQIEEMEIEGAKMVAEEVNEKILEDIKILEEVPEEIQTFYNTDIVEELEDVVEEELEENVVEPAPEEGQAVVFTNEPIEIEIPEKPEPRSLTVKEHKRFLRTGMMPF